MKPTTLVVPTDPHFGLWFECADGHAHYFLTGKCLCDPSRRAPRVVAPMPGGFAAFTAPYCADCIQRNSLRWACGGQT